MGVGYEILQRKTLQQFQQGQLHLYIQRAVSTQWCRTTVCKLQLVIQLFRFPFTSENRTHFIHCFRHAIVHRSFDNAKVD